MQPVDVAPPTLRPRPARHFTPEANWINDPNGLIVVDGTYHLFFQHNPDEPRWGNLHWGHARSDDLVRWEQLPVAIPPDEHGLAFSGSVVIDADNTAGFGPGAMVAVYTQDLDHLERQSLAYSLDGGLTWSRYQHNPVLDAPSGEPDFRDPKVLRYRDGNDEWWVMVIALGAEIALYRSDDLKRWHPTSRLSVSWPWPDSVAEVPDLIRVPVEGTDEWIWTLIVSVIPGTGARRARVRSIPVDFDGITIRPRQPDAVPESVDSGPGLYAPMVWDCAPQAPVLIGWFDESGLDEAAPDPTGSRWCGRMSLPRRLSYASSDAVQPNGAPPTTPSLVLRQTPVAGPFGAPTSVPIAVGPERAASTEPENRFTVDAPCARIDASGRFAATDRLQIRIAGARSTVDIELSADGVSVSGDGLLGDEPAAQDVADDASSAPTTPAGPMGLVDASLMVIVDAGSVEVFLDGGRAAWSAVCDIGLAPTSVTATFENGATIDATPLPSVTVSLATLPP